MRFLSFSPLRLRRILVLAALLGAAGLLPGAEGENAPENFGPASDLPAAETAAPAPTPAETPASSPPRPPPPQHHLGDVIRHFAGPSVLRANESADNMITIGSDARVEGQVRQDCVTILGDAVITGSVDHDCVTVLGSVTIDGPIGHDLVCVLGDVTLGPRAVVHGQLVNVGGQLHADPAAQILGSPVQVSPFGGMNLPSVHGFRDWIRHGLLWGRVLPHQDRWAWVVAGIFLILNLLVAAIFRRPIDACVSVLERRPAMSFVHGLVALLLLPPVIVLLIATVVGILLVPFVIAGVFLAGFAGTIAVYRACGHQLGLRGQPMVALLVGNVIFVLLYALPVLGLAVWAMVGLLGFGCVVTAVAEGLRRDAPQGGPGHASVAARAGAGAGANANTGAPETSAPGTTPLPSDVVAGEQPSAGELTSAPLAAAGEAASAAGVVSPVATVGAETTATAAAPGGAPEIPPADAYPRVGFWPRLGATALDFLLVAGLSNFLEVGFLFPYLWIGYHIAFWSYRATTLGGIVLDLKVVRLDAQPVTFGFATVRALAAIFSFIPAGLGFLWASFDRGRQSWHDKIAGTTIVRVPRGQALV